MTMSANIYRKLADNGRGSAFFFFWGGGVKASNLCNSWGGGGFEGSNLCNSALVSGL